VVTVQRAFRAKHAKVFVPPLPCHLADLKARIIATVKNIDVPMVTRGKNANIDRIDVCRVTRGAHIEHLQLSKKKKIQFSCGCEKFH